MADAKFLMIFIIMTSLFITIFSTQICGAFDVDQNNEFLYDLFILSTYTTSINTCQVGVVNPINSTISNINSTFANSTSALITPSGGATGSFGISSFIDVIKLIVSMLSLLVGLPLYTFFFIIGLPYVVATVLSIFFFVMYMIGVMEFIRGGNF